MPALCQAAHTEMSGHIGEVMSILWKANPGDESTGESAGREHLGCLWKHRALLWLEPGFRCTGHRNDRSHIRLGLVGQVQNVGLCSDFKRDGQPLKGVFKGST